MIFRKGTHNDLEALKALGVEAWQEFKHHLTIENWNELKYSLNNLKTYSDLLHDSECIVCQNKFDRVIGMAFLVSSGHPNEIYDEKWCHLRFVSVHPNYRGLGIGKKLTLYCIDLAKEKGEKIMALHTSEIMGNARRMYENLGFIRLNEIEPRLGLKYWMYTLNLAGVL